MYANENVILQANWKRNTPSHAWPIVRCNLTQTKAWTGIACVKIKALLGLKLSTSINSSSLYIATSDCKFRITIVPCVLRCSSLPICSMRRGVSERRAANNRKQGTGTQKGGRTRGDKIKLPRAISHPRHKINIFITVACHASAPIMAKAFKMSHLCFFSHLFFSPPNSTRTQLGGYMRVAYLGFSWARIAPSTIS